MTEEATITRWPNVQLNMRYHTGPVTLHLYEPGYMADKTPVLRAVGPDVGEPIATLSVCVPALSRHVRKGEVLIKDYGENEGAYEGLLEAGIIRPFSLSATVGTADSRVYICPIVYPKEWDPYD